MPWVERDDTIPSRVEAGSLGTAMILSVFLVVLIVLLATFGAW